MLVPPFFPILGLKGEREEVTNYRGFFFFSFGFYITVTVSASRRSQYGVLSVYNRMSVCKPLVLTLGGSVTQIRKVSQREGRAVWTLPGRSHSLCLRLEPGITKK